MAFDHSAAGDRVAIGSSKGVVHVHGLSLARPESPGPSATAATTSTSGPAFPKHSTPVIAVTFSDDGARLLAAARTSVWCCDAASGAELWSFRAPATARITSACFWRGGALVALGMSDGSVRMFRTSADGRGSVEKLNVFQDAVITRPGFSAFASSNGAAVSLFQMDGEGMVSTRLRHRWLETVAVRHIAISPNGATLWAGGDGGVFRCRLS